MKCLKKFFRCWNQSFNRIELQSDHKLSRFIFSKKHIRVSDNTVRHQAFIPHKDRLDLSVYNTSSLSDSDIWSIGKSFITELRKDKKVAIGRADFRFKDVKKHKELSAVQNGKPHFRHINIENFPSEKAKAKLICIELAKASKLALKGSII